MKRQHQQRRKQLSRLRADQCLRLWEAGYSFRRIGEEVGISGKQACVLVRAQIERAAERRPEAQEMAFDRAELRLQHDFSRTERVIADAEQIADPAKKAAVILAAIRTRARLAEREAKMHGYDRRDDAESIGRGIGDRLADEFRSMPSAELEREVAAYTQGREDEAKMNGQLE